MAVNRETCAQNMTEGKQDLIHDSLRLLSVSIMCLSIHLVVCGPSAIFVFVLFYSVGVQRRDVFMPTLGSDRPYWGPVKFIFPSVYLYLCLSVCISVTMTGRPCQFCGNKIAHPIIARSACGRRPMGQIL